jgi:tetratricopeptide (TPR) repeat protein
MGGQIVFNKDIAKKGIDKIEEGIKLYPNRLDMRFGKIYALGQLEDWGEFTNEIINAIRYSKTNKNQWTWTNNEKQSDGKDFFLSSLQDYQLQLYNTNNDSLLDNMAQIAEEILKVYPKHIESLSNLSISYLIKGEYENALIPLLKAEKINPQDNVVLNNIAYAYKMKGDKTKAVEYYEKVTKYSTGETKESAQQQIEALTQ